MRGFIAGSVGLIALYVLTQQRAASGIAAGAGWFGSALRRLLAEDVAGIPQVGKQPAPAPAASGSGGVVRPQ